MIDKTHLRNTMLALTEAEMAQAHKKYEQFLGSARLDRTETIESGDQAQAEAAADLAEAFDDREHEAQAKLKALQTIDFGPKSSVEIGAVVGFGERFLVIGVSTAAFVCNGQQFIGISPAAPIFAALEGKQKGEDCTFNGRSIHIGEVY